MKIGARCLEGKSIVWKWASLKTRHQDNQPNIAKNLGLSKAPLNY
jgi:hypothetical protein